MRDIKFIIIHCSDSDLPHHDNINVIKEWHVKERGWDDVGYHYFIQKNGYLQIGRPLAVQGAGVFRHNENSVHICLSGKTGFTFHQGIALMNICMAMREKFPMAEVKPHNFFNHHKTCPNFDSVFLFRTFNKYKVDFS